MSMQVTQAPMPEPSAAPPAARRVEAAVTAVQQQASVQQAAKPTAEQVQNTVEKLKLATQTRASNLQFSVDSDTNRTVIRVIDETTKEVIRQIPGEEVLELAKSLDRLSGLLLKDKA